jgi:hypothetical protein
MANGQWWSMVNQKQQAEIVRTDGSGKLPLIDH